MDEYDDVWRIIAMILIVMVFAAGCVLGSYLGKDTLAHDVCVTYGYDIGGYTQGEIKCGYDRVVPDELVPMLGGE